MRVPPSLTRALRTTARRAAAWNGVVLEVGIGVDATVGGGRARATIAERRFAAVGLLVAVAVGVARSARSRADALLADDGHHVAGRTHHAAATAVVDVRAVVGGLTALTAALAVRAVPTGGQIERRTTIARGAGHLGPSRPVAGDENQTDQNDAPSETFHDTPLSHHGEFSYNN